MSTLETVSLGILTEYTEAFMCFLLIRQLQALIGIQGTANAIYQNIAFVDRYDPEYVVVLSATISIKWLQQDA